MVNGIKDYDFQNDCVEYLIDKSIEEDSKKVVTIKAPTGAGKTVILIKYVDEYLKNTDGKTAFVWLCPGKGNLEEQSKDKMDAMAPHIDTRNLIYSMMAGFEGGSVTFINWELVTKKGNTAIKDSEKANLFEKIEEAHREGIKFIIIIDEEHMNNTKKADDVINAFDAKNEIRVSATAKKVSHQEFYEISEDDVINAGLISRAIYVNEGVDENKIITDEQEYEYLLRLADEKRKEILENYERMEVDVRPLVLIQFPVGQPETIKYVEDILANMGYTYDNNMVNIWMSDNKLINPDLTNNDGSPGFLLMKQAISTGWDCPRAKILVKLREGGSEDFQIQTIGRIRRMPEKKHYGLNILDFCYIYTLDSKYKEGLLSSLDKAYQVKRLFVKDEVRDFKLIKENRDLDYDGLGERDILIKVHKHLKDKYKLGDDKNINKANLESGGYNFDHELDSKILQGIFRTTNDMETTANSKRINVKTKVSTHSHGIYLMHSIDEIKRVSGMKAQKVKNILKRMFSKRNGKKYNLVSLNNQDFYAFVINNVKKLKEDFKEVTAENGRQLELAMTRTPKTSEFVIPEMEIYKYALIKNPMLMRLNAYKNYTNEFITNESRSLPERLFERFCEKCDDIEWVYKNGDSGQNYLSIVYTDGFYKQWLFYPDYIVKKTNGEVWIIETKGGEYKGRSKNIDIQISNKFDALKRYASTYGVKWGFVRDENEDLFINTTDYEEDMAADCWVSLDEFWR